MGSTASSDATGLVVHDVLEHYGVKGMHWGTRHDKAAQTVADQIQKVRAAGGTKHDKAKLTTKSKFENKTKAAGGIHKLSDEDLKKMLERLGNEKKYTDILNEDAARRKAHRDTVLKALGEIGKVLLPIVVSAAAGVAAGRAAGGGGVYRTNTINPRVIEGVVSSLHK